MVSETQLTVAFVVLAVALWLVTTEVTDSTVLEGVVLLGVGVVCPVAVTEWRRRRAE
ncbi:MAG: hypothetical protein ABEJ42_09370 [Halobacteriaceae archaeon]